jgi:hypothetical protein
MALIFTIPKDYSAPEGVKEGKEFSEIATFKFDGKDMMLLTIGQDKTPILNREVKEEKAEKVKGAKDAIKEQLGAMEDKKGKASMEDSESENEEPSQEEENY